MADPDVALQQGSPGGCMIESYEGWELEQFILESMGHEPQHNIAPPCDHLREYVGHAEKPDLCDITSVSELQLAERDFSEEICQICSFNSTKNELQKVGSQEIIGSLIMEEVEVHRQLVKEEVDDIVHEEGDSGTGVEKITLGDSNDPEFKWNERFDEHMSHVGMLESFSAADDIVAGAKINDRPAGSVSGEEDVMRLQNILDKTVDQESDGRSSVEDMETMNLKLLHLLLACAEAISESNLELAEVILKRLQELSWDQGSPMQRLAVYMSEALAARLSPSASRAFYRKLRAPLTQSEVLGAFCVFYDVSPIGKFCHLTVNELILDAIAGEERVHIIDLHVGYGTQWAAFLHAVGAAAAGRGEGANGGPPRVRLTAVGPCAEALARTGKKLEETARGVHVPFEYNALALGSLQGFRAGMVEAREGEACVMSSIRQLHTVGGGGEDEDDGAVERFLRELRAAAGGRVVRLLVAENDADHRSPLFLRRFAGCLSYYSAVFESLDAALPRSSQARLKVERLFAGRKIGGILASDHPPAHHEGPINDRHDTMLSWIIRVRCAGFHLSPLPPSASYQARLLLHLYFPNTRFNLTHDHGAHVITLRWNDTPLVAVASFHT